MIKKYIIPSNYKCGIYSLGELPNDKDDSIIFYLEEMEVLTYFTPNYKTEVSFYSVTEDMLEDTLTAAYNDSGQLEYIKMRMDNEEKLLYINLTDIDDAKNKILDFCNDNANILSEKILRGKEKYARLFIECYYDGDAVNIAAKTGTEKEMKEIIEEYGDESSADNSGDYPFKNRIECDNETLRIILLCAPPDARYELYKFAVATISGYIKEHILDMIDKTDDFDFICEEYD
ncbi:MAG: hypothetical protein IJ583_06575 [Firmicutes bacterium]|nr:hypothetical protein [Bacillota bacterium]